MSRPQAGPGPAGYALPPTVGYVDHDITRYQGPVYSLALKCLVAGKSKSSPGPQYDTRGVTRLGLPGEPLWSLRPRLDGSRGAAGSPGPIYLPRIPPGLQYTLAKSLPRKWSSLGPGPAHYKPTYSDRYRGLHYTLAKRLQGKGAAGSPGPGAYYQKELDPLKTKGPQYSLTPRTPGIGNKNPSPGPGAYRPDYSDAMKKSLKYSLSDRRPPWSTIMTVPEDEVDCKGGNIHREECVD